MIDNVGNKIGVDNLKDQIFQIPLASLNHGQEHTLARMMSSSMLSILWLSLVMFISPYSARASAIFSRFSRIKI